MLICPDTSPRGVKIEGDDESWDFGVGAGFYVDATADKWKEHYNMYSYITVELPAIVEAVSKQKRIKERKKKKKKKRRRKGEEQKEEEEEEEEEEEMEESMSAKMERSMNPTCVCRGRRKWKEKKRTKHILFCFAPSATQEKGRKENRETK